MEKISIKRKLVRLKNMGKSVKILATIGPASIDKLILQRLDSAGVDIFRINLSHTKVEDFLDFYNRN